MDFNSGPEGPEESNEKTRLASWIWSFIVWFFRPIGEIAYYVGFAAHWLVFKSWRLLLKKRTGRAQSRSSNSSKGKNRRTDVGLKGATMGQTVAAVDSEETPKWLSDLMDEYISHIQVEENSRVGIADQIRRS